MKDQLKGGRKMEIGKNLQKSFDLFLKNFGVLFMACLIAVIIAAVSFGILAGPLIGGALVLSLKLMRGEKGELNEIFAHFDQFVPTLKATLMLWVASLIVGIIGIIPFIGWIISIAVGPALGLLYIMTIGFVVDQKMKPWEAFRRSIDCCATEPLHFWIYALICGIIAGIGAVIFGIGIILTLPFGIVGFTIVYQQLSTKEAPPFKPEKQILKIAGLALAVLFIGGLVCLTFGFGRTSRNSGIGITTTILGKVTGQKEQLKQSGKKYRFGNLNVGTGLPDNFPSDIPVYPNAAIGGYLGGKNGTLSGSTTTFSSKDAAQSIFDYYVEKLKAGGWEVKTSELGDMKMINFQKGNRKAGITINPVNSKTDILIGITNE
jgi:hypothetical protein